MTTLQITLFGNISVLHPAVSAPVRLARSTQTLLAYLLLQPRLVPREVLMDVFWVETPSDRARSSLTTAIWRLRQALEPDDVRPGTYLVTSHTGEVGFNWDSSHWVDVRFFEQRVYPLLRIPANDLNDSDLQTIEEALSLYRGELLEGVYEDWALRERERYRSIHLNCLTRLMECYAERRDFERSIAYGQEILRRDPVREEIHRALMRIYVENGQRAQAMRQYEQCRELLNRELGVPPLEETRALYQQIVGAPQVGGRAHASSVIIPDLALLIHELQRVQQSIGEANRALARIQAAVNQFASLPQSGDDAVTQK